MTINKRADVAYSGEIIGEHVSMVEMRRPISRIAESPALARGWCAKVA